MVKDDLYIAVPSFFRCPISLDVMKSPVSLCTGVTYDRASIQRWLDSGNNTCPATMQVLHSKDLIPNHTLQRLIQIWSDSVRTRTPNSPPQPNNSLTRDQARDLVQQLVKESHSRNLVLDQISKLNCFARESDENCKFLLSFSDEFLPCVFTVLGENTKNFHLACKAIQLAVMLLENCKKKESGTRFSESILSKIDLGIYFCSSMLIYMRQGSKELRIAAAKLLELIVVLGIKDCFSIAHNLEIYLELLRIVVGSEFDSDAMEASFSCLISLATPRRNRAMLAKANAVRVLSKALSDKELTVSLTEKVLKLLEMASSCKEGRMQICEYENCVETIVKKVLKVSNAATEHAVTILWSLCCLFRDQKAQQAVSKSSGMAKILLLMQSNCSAAVRQMCCDLLKVFRVDSKNSCLSTYDTKTTHIMPF